MEHVAISPHEFCADLECVNSAVTNSNDYHNDLSPQVEVRHELSGAMITWFGTSTLPKGKAKNKNTTQKKS